MTESKTRYNYSVIDITFASKVQVTTTNFLEFHLSTFLSEFGGSLGLWLGLGVAQILQLIMEMVVKYFV